MEVHVLPQVASILGSCVLDAELWCVLFSSFLFIFIILGIDVIFLYL